MPENIFDIFNEKLQAVIKDKKPTFLVAVSGGVDSMVLLHLFKQANADTAVAHCNFGLRGEDSEADMRLVEETAKKYGFPVFIKHCPVPEVANIQLEARRLRYEFFNELMDKHSFDFLATAHHLDDQIETFFINLLRGSGLKGLSGIPENERVFRPLLDVSREEILNYAHQRDIIWREDKSNAETKYLRNKIRHELIPVLEKIKPDFRRSFLRVFANLREERIFSDTLFREKAGEYLQQKEGTISFDLTLYRQKPLPDIFFWKWLSPYGFQDINEVIKLLHAPTGKYIASKTHRLYKHGRFLVLEPRKKTHGKFRHIFHSIEEINLHDIPVSIEKIPSPSREEIRSNPDPYTIYINTEKFKPPYEIRPWQPGDRFKPFGMRHFKKVGDFLTDIKLPRHKRKNVYVLLSAGRIVWVVGYRTDNDFAVGDNDKEVWKIQWNPR